MNKPRDKLKVKPKKVETVLQRIERLTHLYDDGPKPKHFDDKSIVDMEEWNKMNGLEKKTPVIMKPKITRPKQFRNEDPSSYPMNQKKTLNTWETMLAVAKNPKTKEDREEANHYKRMINKDYYNHKTRKFLGEEELKFIGKHPSQRVKQPEIKIPSVDLNYKPYVSEPTPSLEEAMRSKVKFKPGISADLVKINTDIKKNIDYVLGTKDEKSESENEKTQTNKEDKFDR
tara:strand:+ start:467 stop:1156 length:690 start_codon:yes stop_codon:yes gene_type:complete